MNKDVIKKYKAEFEWWLNGGEVLMRDNNNCWFNSNPNWSEDMDKWTYIINDEYVEFRKALAEGKTVEMHGEVTFQWVKMSSDNFELAPSEYRIKPDEPFKVGDYVIHPTFPNKIEVIGEYSLKQNPNYYGDCKLWTLEEANPDEWVLLVAADSFEGCSVQNAKSRDDLDYFNLVPYIGQTPKELGLEK